MPARGRSGSREGDRWIAEDSDERPVAPSAVTSTISVAPHKIAITEAPQRIVLDVPLRTVGQGLWRSWCSRSPCPFWKVFAPFLFGSGMALSIAIALNPAVVRVEQLMRRNWAVVCVFFGFIVGLIVVVTLLVAPFVSQINDLPKTAPHIAERLTRNPLIHRLDQHYNIVAKAEAHAGSAPSIVFGAAGAVIKRDRSDGHSAVSGGVHPFRTAEHQPTASPAAPTTGG